MRAKITYNDYGTMRAKIIHFNGWYNVNNDIISLGIQENQVTKIEIMMEVSPENIEDLTETND